MSADRVTGVPRFISSMTYCRAGRDGPANGQWGHRPIRG